MTFTEYEEVFSSSVLSKLEEIGHADILIGIPCLNNETTIGPVIHTVSEGLSKHYPNYSAVRLVADGGSTDSTCEQFFSQQLYPRQHKIFALCRGKGKGWGLRTIFAAAVKLRVRASITVDADLRSITPAWIAYFLEPLLIHDYEFVAPLYARHKYDGTITNNLVYCLTRAIYGKRIRQPIGGDFAFSQRLASHYLEQPVWTTDVARFGIDVWMTIGAIVTGSRICQTNLGVKIHDPKDPASSLGPMFQQVCNTLFTQIEQHNDFWSPIKGSESIETFGLSQILEPEPISIDLSSLVQEFKHGFSLSRTLYQLIFSEQVFQTLQQASESSLDNSLISD